MWEELSFSRSPLLESEAKAELKIIVLVKESVGSSTISLSTYMNFGFAADGLVEHTLAQNFAKLVGVLGEV